MGSPISRVTERVLQVPSTTRLWSLFSRYAGPYFRRAIGSKWRLYDRLLVFRAEIEYAFKRGLSPLLWSALLGRICTGRATSLSSRVINSNSQPRLRSSPPARWVRGHLLNASRKMGVSMQHKYQINQPLSTSWGVFQAMQIKKRFRWWYSLIIIGFAGLHFLAYGISAKMMFYCGWPTGRSCDQMGSAIESLGTVLFYILTFPGILLSFLVPSNAPNVVGVGLLILTDFLWGYILFLISYRFMCWIMQRKRRDGDTNGEGMRKQIEI